MARKSLKEEIRVVEYMSELAPKTFGFISEMLESGEKSDKKWAVEQMSKLYSKAVPTETDVTSLGEKIVFMPQEIINKFGLNETSPSTEPDSSGQPPISGN